MLELARVVAVHPEDHSLDVVIMRTGQRCVGVTLMSGMASAVAGSSDLPTVAPPAGNDRWRPPQRGAQDVEVWLAPTASGAGWVAVGFKFPEVNAVLNAEAGRRVYRHSSGTWHMIAPDGTVTIGFPSGAIAVMGPNLEPTNPVGGDVDGRWANSGPAASAQVGLHIAFPSGASFQMSLDGKFAITGIDEGTIDVPLLKLTGRLEAQGDVKAGSVSLQEHRHREVTPGGGQSGVPVV